MLPVAVLFVASHCLICCQSLPTWFLGGITDELEGSTPTFPTISNVELELDSDAQGKIIRVYWAPDKQWYIGKIGKYDFETKEHKIEYDDEISEDINLTQLDDERPAWEISPFTTEYFGF